ncbi:MAG: cysteine desulfurase family protein [Lachnospiraceae bacterium]
MEIYFDNAATTQCCNAAADIMRKVLISDFGNPSSLHRKGMEAERYISDARKKIAGLMKVKEKEIIFTSGGTESNNLALLAAADSQKRRGNHIITTRIEHPSVAMPIKKLQEKGFEVTFLPADSFGRIRLSDIQDALCKDTILVSIMHINNELGTIQPIEEAATLIHAFDPNILFHVDAVQSFGKQNLRPISMGIDLLSASAHKIHGPKGVGFLYIKDKLTLSPIMYGGGQQRGLRQGTENVPAIAGFGEAALQSYALLETKTKHLQNLQNLFLKQICEIEGVSVNGAIAQSDQLVYAAPHITSIRVADIRSEVLLHSLEEYGIYISAGSACASNKREISQTLLAAGLNKNEIDTTVRFSFCADNTIEEVETAVKALKEIIPIRRKFVRK